MGNFKDKSSTTWRREDEATLVRILKQQKASGNWGDNNPKKVAWTVCETALTGSEVMSSGAPKTLVSIKNHWQRVQFVSSNLLCII